VSLIGTLEQFSLSNVLRRIEIHEKTGLLVVKQRDCWVEFYFRNGRLLCIGPLRTQATLGERLVNDLLISPPACHEVEYTLGDAKSSETRVALALMDLGYIGRDQLRAWAIQKATDVLRVILTWSSGDVYFEENTPPPSDRLLVSMSAISIIDSVPQSAIQSDHVLSSRSSQLSQSRLAQPAQATSLSSTVQQTAIFNTTQAPINRISRNYTPSVPPIVPATPKPDVARVPTLMGFDQFFGDTVLPSHLLQMHYLQQKLSHQAFLTLMHYKISHPLSLRIIHMILALHHFFLLRFLLSQLPPYSLFG
jgi:hypothetical protein